MECPLVDTPQSEAPQKEEEGDVCLRTEGESYPSQTSSSTRIVGSEGQDPPKNSKWIEKVDSGVNLNKLKERPEDLKVEKRSDSEGLRVEASVLPSLPSATGDGDEPLQNGQVVSASPGVDGNVISSSSFSGSGRAKTDDGQISASSESVLSSGKNHPAMTYSAALRVGIGDLTAVSGPSSGLQRTNASEKRETEKSRQLIEEAQIMDRSLAATVWFRKSFAINNDTYLDAVGKVVGDNHIVAINTDDRNRVEIVLSDKSRAERLVQEGIIIEGDWYKAYRIAERPLKVSLARVPHYVPHSVLVDALAPYGACTVSDAENIHAYTHKISRKHVITFRRNIWLRVDPDSMKLPASLVIYYAGTPHTVDITDNVTRCFQCGKTGHMRARCPSGSPNYEPVGYRAPHYGGERGEKDKIGKPEDVARTSHTSDIDNWRAGAVADSPNIDVRLPAVEKWLVANSKKKNSPVGATRNRAPPPAAKARFSIPKKDSKTKASLKGHRAHAITQELGHNDGKNVLVSPKQIQAISGPGLSEGAGMPEKDADVTPGLSKTLICQKEKDLGTSNDKAYLKSDQSASVPPNLEIIAELRSTNELEKLGSESSDMEKLPPISASQKEKKQITRLSRSYIKACKYFMENKGFLEDPLGGMSIEQALNIFRANQDFFQQETSLQGIGDFLDGLAADALMDHSDGPIKKPLKRGAPSSTTFTEADDSPSDVEDLIRRSKKVNNLDSPQKEIVASLPETGPEGVDRSQDSITFEQDFAPLEETIDGKNSQMDNKNKDSLKHTSEAALFSLQ